MTLQTRLAGPREPRWKIELLNRKDASLGVLDGVSEVSVEVSATERLGGSASLTIDDRNQNIDWLSHRVRVSYDPGVQGVDPWPIGLFLLTSPTLTRHDGRTSWQVDLLTKMAVVDSDAFEDTFSLPAGADVIPAVLSVILSTGETRVAHTDRGAVLRSGLAWVAGTSKLTIVNELLEAAGYRGLWCDSTGQYRVEPYVAPGERAVSWVFEAGETSIHKPDWTREQDLASVPNLVVCATSGTDEEPGLVGVARNDDPDSPLSTVSRGRVITKTYDVEADSQSTVDSLAQRYLLENLGAVARLQVTHAPVPLEPQSAVLFAPRGVDPRTATVQKMRFTSGFDSQVQAEWREI